jgi:transcriptional regulator with XRE-family HTH domain
MRQPNIARLESGEHEPSLATLTRLSSVLGLDFSIEIKSGELKLRQALHA